MPYLELSLRSTEAEQPRYERALEDVGALSVTMLDADADTPNERAILEPGVGQTPVWKSLVLTALFDAQADALALLAALEAFDPELDWAGASFRQVEDQDARRHRAVDADDRLDVVDRQLAGRVLPVLAIVMAVVAAAGERRCWARGVGASGDAAEGHETATRERGIDRI